MIKSQRYVVALPETQKDEALAEASAMASGFIRAMASRHHNLTVSQLKMAHEYADGEHRFTVDFEITEGA